MTKRRAASGKLKISFEEMLSELPPIDSAKLATLRRTVAAITSLKELLGPIAQFHVVVDANVLIGEVIWAAKRKTPEDVAISTNVSKQKPSSHTQHPASSAR